MATATKTTVRKATTRKRRFDGSDSDHWHEIPSKGQFYALAIAAFNGAKFPGSDTLSSRALAKEIITQAKEDGFLDEK